MVRKSIFGAAVLLLMTVGAQANLLTNGDFNTGDLTGWWSWVPDSSTQSITVEAVGSYDGTPDAVLASATDGSWLEMGQSFACSANTTYTLTLAYKSTGWVGGGLNLKYVDASWYYLNYEWVTLLSSASEGSDTWTTYSYTFTTPDSTGYTEVKFTMGGWGSLYLDDVNVTPEPATLLLLGLGGVVLRKRA